VVGFSRILPASLPAQDEIGDISQVFMNIQRVQQIDMLQYLADLAGGVLWTVPPTTNAAGFVHQGDALLPSFATDKARKAA
jgi:hypothetical protein